MIKITYIPEYLNRTLPLDWRIENQLDAEQTIEHFIADDHLYFIHKPEDLDNIKNLNPFHKLRRIGRLNTSSKIFFHLSDGVCKIVKRGEFDINKIKNSYSFINPDYLVLTQQEFDSAKGKVFKIEELDKVYHGLVEESKLKQLMNIFEEDYKKNHCEEIVSKAIECQIDYCTDYPAPEIFAKNIEILTRNDKWIRIKFRTNETAKGLFCNKYRIDTTKRHPKFDLDEKTYSIYHRHRYLFSKNNM